MDCTRCRDVLSACLDGEEPGPGDESNTETESEIGDNAASDGHIAPESGTPGPAARAHAHVDVCAACADWLADAYRLRALTEHASAREPKAGPDALPRLLRILRDRSAPADGPAPATGSAQASGGADDGG